MNKLPEGSLQIVYQTGDGLRYFLGDMMESTDLHVVPKVMITLFEQTEATLCNPHQLHKIDMSKYNRVIIDQNVISKNPRARMTSRIVKVCQGKDVVLLRYIPLNNFKGDCYKWDASTRALVKMYIRPGLPKVAFRKLHEGFTDPMTRFLD